MLFSQFLSNLKSTMEQYDSAGMITDVLVYDWVVDTLKQFSILPSSKMETIITIKNNKGRLPDGFKTISSAVTCEPFGYTCDEGKDILQDTYFYKTREIRNTDWNFCNPCDIVETESCVVEKIYLHTGSQANFYYNNPKLLRLTPHIKRTMCEKDCPNLREVESPYEISINNKTIYTNFKEGTIFLVYNGLEEDEDGFLIIPETDTDEQWLNRYLLAKIKRMIIERILTNSDNNTNEQFLYKMYFEEEQNTYPKAMGELKMKKVMMGLNNYRRKIKKEFSVYNFGS